MSNYIFHDDFLLSNEASKILYHGYAAGMPIIDYHNHLPPQEIADNKKFNNLTDIWLRGDHYKWRAMRTLGINEELITGNAPDEEKFQAWAGCVPQTIRNPLFHWTHLELKDPFGVKKYLNAETAGEIYKTCKEKLGTDDFSTQGLLKHFNVKLVCTTDDPCDDLAPHITIANEPFGTKVVAGFRPDKVFAINNREAFLEVAANTKIASLDDLLLALQNRVDYFHEYGCRMSDHGLVTLPNVTELAGRDLAEVNKVLSHRGNDEVQHETAFAGKVLLELCRMYHKKGWVQQFHLGPIRNNNTRYFKKLGADTGFDSVGDDSQASSLSFFLNELDKTDQLTKTIIYNINPSQNEVFATAIGNFNDGTVKGKIQFGSGWWFNDTLDGMTKQLNSLSSMGILSCFVGMLTDSRSFLSFPRHEYFRRWLCNILGQEIENGLLPNDEKWIGKIVQDISFNNAKQYFGLSDI